MLVNKLRNNNSDVNEYDAETERRPACRMDGPQVLRIVLSQVVLGRPTGLLQSVGGRSAAAMTRWWSSTNLRTPVEKNNCLLIHSDTLWCN